MCYKRALTGLYAEQIKAAVCLRMLRRVLRDLPAAKTVDEVEALLPWNFNSLDFVL